MSRIVAVAIVACLLAGCRMPAQSFDECVQQETRPDMTRHETFEVRRRCAEKFPPSASAASGPAVPHGNPMDQFDVQPPSTTPAPPPVKLPPSPASPP